jgi:hypothetical protein
VNTSSLAARLRDLIETRGYAIERTDDIDRFKALCATLGPVELLTDVRIVPGKTEYPFRPAAVPFHTDHPRHPIVAWYCVRKDVADGANLLIDSRVILERLTPYQRARLSGASVRIVQSQERRTILGEYPFHAYWLPPLIREAMPSLDDETRAAVGAFQRELDARAESGTAVPVRLEEGEALFVNNHVMLHGRKSISHVSDRHLIRACMTRP